MKIIFIGLSISVLNLQCSLWPDCNSKDVKPYFNITGLQQLYVEVQSPAIWQEYKTPKVISPTDILWVTAAFEANFYSIRPMTTIMSLFVNSAYACSPADPGYKGSKEEYKSIIITSETDFDNSHPSGSDLSDLFVIPIDGGPKYTPLGEYIQANPRVSLGLKFKLGKYPTISKKHVFTVSVELKNGEKYMLKNSEILFE